MIRDTSHLSGASSSPVPDRFSDFIPADPINTHAPRGRWSHSEIAGEKRNYSKILQDKALKFDKAYDREMVSAAIDLMHEFHFNQFRGGSPVYHFTNHTTSVALEARLAALDPLAKTRIPHLLTANGDILSPAAVAMTIGALHDSREDFYRNFTGTSKEITPEQGAAIVDARIRQRLGPIIGASATERILNTIKLLTLTNKDEFPTREYVGAITSDFYARCVKQADYNHNLETFPNFSPAYALLIVPAQYQPIIAWSKYEREYAEKLLLNLAKFDPGELVPWDEKLRQRNITTLSHVIDLFDRYNEPEALKRLATYYRDLSEDLLVGDYSKFLSAHGLHSADMRARIRDLCMLLTPVLPEFLRGTAPATETAALPEVTEQVIGKIPLQILGPMQGWGGEIVCNQSERQQLEDCIRLASAERDSRIPGYFIDRPDGNIVFHISRYPRQAEQQVPSLESYRSNFEALQEKLTLRGINFTALEEPLPLKPALRVVLGLQEGYFDGRKDEILALVDNKTITNTTELTDVLEKFLGNYRSLGIDIGESDNFDESVAALRKCSLSLLHTTGEVSRLLGSSFKVEAGEVYSAAPEYARPYQEPAAVITAPATKEHFERLLWLADQMKQARFSVENLTTAIVANVEIKSFSGETAAAMI